MPPEEEKTQEQTTPVVKPTQEDLQIYRDIEKKLKAFRETMKPLKEEIAKQFTESLPWDKLFGMLDFEGKDSMKIPLTIEHNGMMVPLSISITKKKVG